MVNSVLSAILVLALVFSAMEDGRVFVGRGPIFIFVTLVTCLKTRFESTRSECAFFCTNVFERDFVIEDLAWPGLVWPALARGRGCSTSLHRVHVMLSTIAQVSEDCT